jgi:hypothetical protein
MTGGNYEEISDINGMAIPCMYYDHVLKKMGASGQKNISSIYEILENEINQLKRNKRNARFSSMIEKKVEKFSKKCSHTADYLYLSNMYIALKEHLYFKLSQISIEDYKWLPPSVIRQSFKIIRTALADDFLEGGDECPPTFSPEETIIQYDEDYKKMDEILENADVRLFRLNARVDLVTSKTVWEIKCTTNTTIEHQLQVVLYAWIWRVALEMPARNFKIMNIKTGEILELKATDSQLTDVVLEIFKNKYTRHKIRTTDEFLEEATGGGCV